MCSPADGCLQLPKHTSTKRGDFPHFTRLALYFPPPSKIQVNSSFWLGPNFLLHPWGRHSDRRKVSRDVWTVDASAVHILSIQLLTPPSIRTSPGPSNQQWTAILTTAYMLLPARRVEDQGCHVGGSASMLDLPKGRQKQDGGSTKHLPGPSSSQHQNQLASISAPKVMRFMTCLLWF